MSGRPGISPETKKEIAAFYAISKSQRDTAKRFKVSVASVCLIVNGKKSFKEKDICPITGWSNY